MNVNKKTTVIGNILLLTFSISLSLFLVEWALGKYVRRIKVYSELFTGSPYPATFSSYLPFTLPENVNFRHQTPEFDVLYRFNRFGYRGDAPKEIAKNETQKRIIVCGDSFGLGWGIPLAGTFVHKLQEELRPLHFEVINASYHAGYSPDSYYAYLVNEGIRLRPDMIVVTLYSGNDVEDMRDNKWLQTDRRGAATRLVTIRLYTDYKGRLICSPKDIDSHLPWNFRVPILRESHLFIGITQLVNELIARSPNGAGLRGRLGERLEEDEAWRRLKISVKATTEWCRENNIDLVYVLIPPRPERRSRKVEQTHERMKRIVEAEMDCLLDMAPQLPQGAYFTLDGHLNEVGHELVAEAILAFLAQKHLR